MKYFCILLVTSVILFLVQGHSVNNKQLLWVEPITAPKLDIATRTDHFFEKRKLSVNTNYQPNVRSLQYDDSLRLSLNAFNKTIYLHLTPNYDLFHPNAVFHQGSQSVLLNPKDFRVYQGHVVDEVYSEYLWRTTNAGFLDGMENQPGVLGWARITVRNDIKHDMDYPMFEGAFSLYGDIHHIKLKDNYHLTKRSDDAELQSHVSNSHMIIYRDSDIVQVDSDEDGCGSDRLQFQNTASIAEKVQDYYNPLEIIDSAITPSSLTSFRSSFLASHNTRSTLFKRASTGCPTSKKILYMGAAADCTYVKYYQSLDNARMQIINDWNSVSSVYASTFNVAIGLINITIMDSTCPTTPSSATNWNQECSTSYSISSRLSDFSKWRGSLGDDGAGLWHLMTNCATGVEVGIAWLSQVCNTKATQSQGGYTSGTGVSSVIRDEWKVVAHEIGHGFGAIHDCTSQTCPCSGSSCQCCPYSSSQCDAGGKYIMNPTSNASADAFSPCSITTICGYMPDFMSCLEDPGARNITTLKMCGNGIKEAGEDCDTGGQPSQCCDTTTCKFKSNAVCDDFNDLCCSNCQLRPANYTCRPSSGVCDIAEVCNGTSGDCPSDKFKDDLSNCGNGLQCASGQCTSRDAQCLARGVSSNIKQACSADSSCSIICQSPQSAFQCTIYPGNFVDGTPCGVGGVCKAGSCNTDNFLNNAKSWIDSHLSIFIPVVVIAGLLILFALFRCCCYNGRSGYNGIGKTTVYTVPSAAQPYNTAAAPYYPGQPPPQHQQPYYQPPSNAWVDPALYNGGDGGHYNNGGLQQPLPAYSQRDVSGGNNNRGGGGDAYEMNNASQWNSNNVPQSPAPRYQPTPTPMPIPPPHSNGSQSAPPGQRTYNEGVV